MAAATGLRAPRGIALTTTPAVVSAGLDGFFAGVVEATEDTVLSSLLQAPTVVGRDGNTSEGLPAGAVTELLRTYRR